VALRPFFSEDRLGEQVVTPLKCRSGVPPEVARHNRRAARLLSTPPVTAINPLRAIYRHPYAASWSASNYASRVAAEPRIAVFGPHPMLSITVEALTSDGGDEIHLHAAGQGVWVARMAAELGARPVLCGFIGGETGRVLRPLLGEMDVDLRLVETGAESGCYLHDRRSGERVPIAQSAALPPSRHEVDELFSSTVAAAIDCGVLAVCGPYPGEALPLEIFGALVADVRANGARVVVDLSPPRLDSALEGRPDLVKINDWELAKYITGPVDTEERMREAAQRLLEAGAGAAIITRAEEPAMVLRGDDAWELVPPRFERGAREGCGDSMMGGLAYCMAAGLDWEETLRTSAAAGAANFLRAGLGSGTRAVIEDIARKVELRPL
jgi:1-phosphofructokinase